MTGITVRAPGRCTACSFHVATQGHRDGCDGNAPVIPDPPPGWDEMSFLVRIAWRKSQRDGELCTAVHSSKPITIPAAPGANPEYVRKAIGDELATLAALPAVADARNDTLNKVALKVFGFAKSGHADKQACWNELHRIALAIGLDETEIVGATGTHGTLGSAWNAATPRQVPAPGLQQVTRL
jgi:hypothetical protein